MSEKTKIAVYGTLKKGFINHSLIASEQYIGSTTLSDICLYDIGPYPGARREPSLGIAVEVYSVSHEVLSRLDALEEYNPQDPQNSLYTRELFATSYGAAWVYLYQGSIAGKPRQQRGAWYGRVKGNIAMEEDPI